MGLSQSQRLQEEAALVSGRSRSNTGSEQQGGSRQQQELQSQPQSAGGCGRHSADAVVPVSFSDQDVPVAKRKRDGR